MKLRTPAIVLAALALASGASASAPEPRKPFAVDRMAGRWYEIARTPNRINRGCEASTTDWRADGAGKFKFDATCRQGSPSGPARVISGEVRITDPASHAKVRMFMFGGLISHDYWLLDHADDYSWLIMGTPSGSFISIMAAHPSLPKAEKAQALLDARAMGYDVSKLVFPIQPAAD